MEFWKDCPYFTWFNGKLTGKKYSNSENYNVSINQLGTVCENLYQNLLLGIVCENLYQKLLFLIKGDLRLPSWK